MLSNDPLKCHLKCYNGPFSMLTVIENSKLEHYCLIRTKCAVRFVQNAYLIYPSAKYM